MKPLAIQLYTLRDAMANGNHLPILKELAATGYKGIEGHGFGMPNTEFRKVVEDMGMKVSSYFGECPTPDTVNQFIDAARDLGVSDTVCGFGPPEYASVEAIKETAKKLNAVAPAIVGAGLTFSLHNHWWEYEIVEGRLAIEWMVDECPDVTLELDTYWATNFAANKAADMVTKFGKKVKLMHVKDGPMVRDEPMTAAGAGKVDIAEAIRAGDPNWLILEMDYCATDMMEAVKESYRYLVGNGLAAGNKPA
ncbi:MAG: TIM barrel protein [Fimbriimonas sp.]|nr:TIM barrel protein [Fimbriimonas sp.]